MADSKYLEDISIILDPADIEDGVGISFKQADTGLDRRFRLIRLIGVLFFFKGTESNQIEGFKGNVTITAPIPPDVLQFINKLDIQISRLRLGYYDKNNGRWLAFQYQTINEDQVTVQFSYWLEDPGVGWGFVE